MLSPKGEFFFPDVFRPSDRSGKYEITVRIKPSELTGEDKEAWEAMVNRAREIAKTAFSCELDAVTHPFTKGKADHKTKNDVDSFYIKFKTTSRPGVVGPDPNVNLEPNEIYGGAIGRVSFNPKDYDVNGNKGVAFYLNNVQLTDAGERKGGERKQANEEFGNVDSETATDLFC